MALRATTFPPGGSSVAVAEPVLNKCRGSCAQGRAVPAVPSARRQAKRGLRFGAVLPFLVVPRFHLCSCLLDIGAVHNSNPVVRLPCSESSRVLPAVERWRQRCSRR